MLCLPWFCQNAVFLLCFLPKCCSFTFSQEYFVFNQQNLKFFCVNLTQKFYLSFASPTMCFVTYWRNMWPWRHCYVFYLEYIFSGGGNHISSYTNCRDFCDFHKSVPCFYHCLPWFSTIPGHCSLCRLSTEFFLDILEIGYIDMFAVGTEIRFALCLFIQCSAWFI